ncbi:amidohydrolase [Sphingomonas sp. Root710]|uniref:N-acyl-D-amino-acid deacylase family protein n=1 Tax=Sphingomonas sp. Root710 TaxID=1736594 RepID=UPI00070064F1|nr:amidohydrolase family protein [Sphingomonas sp. Root710]KRB83008.1 amidohydrolase [Sphingomonas sp. Root710]
MTEYDLVIRGGEVTDGSGAEPRTGDVALKDGKIAQIGRVSGTGTEEIDAAGCLVTPGFVDLHTHFDGQALWENRLTPSSQHGVTTAVAGNCGIGFAPCRPEDHETLIKFMEGVEDIPEAVMAEGLPWNWESFADYMNAIEQRSLDIDLGVQVPHSPLRIYTMGKRGVDREPSTQADRAQMRALVAGAVRAGAMGVSTSRAHVHCARDGSRAPSVGSADAELLALAAGLRDAGGGVFQLITEFTAPAEQEFAVMRAIARTSGRPLSFTFTQSASAADRWKSTLVMMAEARREGLDIRGQIFPRPVGVLLGLDLSFNPFSRRASYQKIHDLPLAEKVRIMRNPEFRARLLAEPDIPENLPLMNLVLERWAELYALGDPPRYFPDPRDAAGARADRAGVPLADFLYDLLLTQDGHAVLYLPIANFAGNSRNAIASMMRDTNTVLGLGDGGAHYGLICDASFPTTLLTDWVRDAQVDHRLSVGRAIQMLTSEPAAAIGLSDRGRLAPGMLADVNVIDMAALRLGTPKVRRDLPGGGRRLIQEAQGYRVTIKRGAVTYRNGVATEALPGGLLRGAVRAAA